jgi:hypothetical protein
MLGLDVIGVTALSPFGGSSGGGGSNAGTAAADKVASKAAAVSSRAGKAKGIAAYAKKAAAAAKNTKGKLASAAAKAKKKVIAKKPAATAAKAAAAARGISPAAVSRSVTAAPRTLTARGTRMVGDDDGGGLYAQVQQIDPALLRQAIADMNGYDTGLDQATNILGLVGQINQLLPAVQAAGLTDLYNQGNALLNEAYNCDPSNVGDLPSRCQTWITQAQSAGAYPGVAQPQQAPMDAGGGGDYGGGGGGGGFPAPAAAADDGGGGDYDPEAASADEAASIEDETQGGDDGDGYQFADDGGGDPYFDQDDEVAGLRGLDIIGAGPSLIGLDVGVDINAANKAVRGAKPLSRALAAKFIALATKALQAANMLDTQEGATARRDAIIESLGSMQSTIDAHPALDPLPEAGAQNSPAEMLRNKVLQAITEYNSAAQGAEDLSEARAQLWQDFVDSAKNLASKAGDTALSVLTVVKWLAIGAAVVVTGGACYFVYEKGMRSLSR